MKSKGNIPFWTMTDLTEQNKVLLEILSHWPGSHKLCDWQTNSEFCSDLEFLPEVNTLWKC